MEEPQGRALKYQDHKEGDYSQNCTNWQRWHPTRRSLFTLGDAVCFGCSLVTACLHLCMVGLGVKPIIHIGPVASFFSLSLKKKTTRGLRARQPLIIYISARSNGEVTANDNAEIGWHQSNCHLRPPGSLFFF
jgi:hypothetical protein